MGLAEAIAASQSVQRDAGWRDEALAQDFLVHCRDLRNLSPATVTKYGGVLTAWLRWATHPSRKHHVVDIDMAGRFVTRHRRDGVRCMNEKGQPSTMRGDLAAMRAWGRWLIARGYVTSNPFEGVPSPKMPRQEPDPLPDHVWLRLWLSATSAEARASLGLGYFCGFRRAEIVTLDCSHFDLDHGIITGFTRKGGGEDTFPLAEVVGVYTDRHPSLIVDETWFLGALDSLCAGRRSGPLFQAWAGKRHSVLNHRMALWADLAGIEDQGVHPHRLRHSFVTNMLRAGVPLPIVQRLANHASATQTMRYAKIGGNELAEWRRANGV